jgi:hypothetical protein
MIMVLVVLSLLMVTSCGQKTAASPTGTNAGTANPAASLVSDAKSGFSVRGDIGLYELSDSKILQWKENIALGEKLELLGEASTGTLSGKPNDVIKVRLESGKEGWSFPAYIIPNSLLAVITSEEAMVYSQPKNTAVTTMSIPRKTIVAIYRETAGSTFIKVSFYYPDDKTTYLQKEVFLRNTGVSSAAQDVQTVILLRLAANAKSDKQKKELLGSAKTDYPTSAFITDVEDEIAKMSAPAASDATAEKPTEAFSASLVVNDENVNVRSVPDEKTGSVVAHLSKGRTVDVVEKTVDSYTIESETAPLHAPWYRIREPAGWVFGTYLEPGQ